MFVLLFILLFRLHIAVTSFAIFLGSALMPKQLGCRATVLRDVYDSTFAS